MSTSIHLAAQAMYACILGRSPAWLVGLGFRTQSVIISLILTAPLLFGLSPSTVSAAQADSPLVEYDRSTSDSVWGGDAGIALTAQPLGDAWHLAFPTTFQNFPFYGKRYNELVASKDGRICFGPSPTLCPVTPASEANFRAGPPAITPAWSDVASNSALVPTFDVSPEGSWLRVSWVSVAGFPAVEAFDAVLYKDGRVRMDYGPDSRAVDAIEGVNPGPLAANPARVMAESPMVREFVYSATYHPFVATDVYDVRFDQPKAGQVWVNGVYRGTLDIPHAIVVGSIVVKASSSLAIDKVTLDIPGQSPTTAQQNVQRSWSPTTTGQRYTLRATTDQSREIATVDVMVLDALSDLLAYQVDIHSPRADDVFSQPGAAVTRMDVPITWSARTDGCPADITFYEHYGGRLTSGIIVKGPFRVGLADVDRGILMPVSLIDSSRTRLSAEIVLDEACFGLVHGVAGTPGVAKTTMTPPFIVDTNCQWIKVSTSQPEDPVWLREAPSVTASDSRHCKNQAYAQTQTQGQTGPKFHFVVSDFEEPSGFCGSQSANREWTFLPLPLHGRAQEFSATNDILLLEGSCIYRPPMRAGDVFSFLVNPDAPATVRAWVGGELVIDTIVPGLTWTLVTSVPSRFGEGATAGTVKVEVAGPGLDDVGLDYMIQASSAPLPDQGKAHIIRYEAARESEGIRAETFRLNHWIDTVPPFGTASIVSNSGWVPLSRAVPASIAEADVTILLAGTDATSGVKSVRIEDDQGRIETLPYATQIPWTFQVPWVCNGVVVAGCAGRWISAERKLKAWFIDAAGWEAEEPANASVYIDATYPDLEPPQLAAWIGTKTPTISVNVTDPDSGPGIVGEFVVAGAPSTTFAGAISGGVLQATLGFSGTGSYSVTARARDVAGNWGSVTFPIGIDVTTPSASMSAPTYTRITSVSVVGSATDAESGMQALRMAEVVPGETWDPVWTLAVNGSFSRTLPLTSADGQKTIRGEFRDVAGNIRSKNTTTILDTKPPTITPVSPEPDSEGNSVVGLKVQATFNDANGGVAVSGLGTDGLVVRWYDGVTGSTTDVTNDPRMTKSTTGFTYEPVVIPGKFYKVYVQKADRAGNVAAYDWGFWTA